MLTNVEIVIILQHFCHLVFAEFNNFSFSFYFLSDIFKNNDFPPILPLTYGMVFFLSEFEVLVN